MRPESGRTSSTNGSVACRCSSRLSTKRDIFAQACPLPKRATCSGPTNSAELYQLLVIEREWSAKRYGRWIADALTAALLA